MTRRPFIAALATVVVALAVPAVAVAAETSPLTTTASPVSTAALLALLGLLPFVLVVTTSFAKITVVLSVLRSALGTQNVPPNIVLAALAVILSGYVMAPVATEMAAAAGPRLAEGIPAIDDFAGWSVLANATTEPLARFLAANSGRSELVLFTSMRDLVMPDDPAELPLYVLSPAFTITELAEAFQIGFLIFLPFLVLDLLVGAVLLSLGMHMLSPTAVSMPFKLLLFVLVDGWVTLSHSLVLGYAYGGGSP